MRSRATCYTTAALDVEISRRVATTVAYFGGRGAGDRARTANYVASSVFLGDRHDIHLICENFDILF